MRALLSPASLKGVLSAARAAAALGRGARAAGLEADELPVADGGEGTAEVIQLALGGEWREAGVSDPFGRPVTARWLALPDGRAVVEAAAAIGLPLLESEELDPLRASSRGLGELVLAALDARPASLVVTLGGTATMDGGEGLRELVRSLPVPCVVLADVRTLLRDAARVFGPQKGASPTDVAVLERRLAGMEELNPVADLPGSGAAGGLGAAFAALGAELVPGAPAVLDLLRFDEQLARCDVVVTGEGTVDATTGEGKAPGEVARRAAVTGARCIVFGGRVRASVPGAEIVELSGDPARAEADLEELAQGTSGREFALAGLGGFEPVGHRLEQCPGDLGPGLDEGPEDEDREAVAGQVRRRGDRRGSRSAVDEGDLAERVAGAELADLFTVDFDGSLTALDDEEHEAAFALERHGVSRREPSLVELLGQALEILVLEAREQADLAQEVRARLRHGAIHTRCAPPQPGDAGGS